MQVWKIRNKLTGQFWQVDSESFVRKGTWRRTGSFFFKKQRAEKTFRSATFWKHFNPFTPQDAEIVEFELVEVNSERISNQKH